MNNFTELDFYIDIVLIAYMFCVKIIFSVFFFFSVYERNQKSGDAQGDIINK